MVNPLISFIVPVYNVELYLKKSLDSILNQTYKNLEIILIDDGSTDQSGSICDEYATKDHRIQVVHQENKGLSATRNVGISLITGDYIYFMDSDDEIISTCIETLIAPILMDESVEMVQGNYVYCSVAVPVDNTKKNPPLHILSNDVVNLHYYKYRTIHVSVWNKLLKRSFVIDNQLLFRDKLLFEDHLWSFNLIKHLQHAYVYDDDTYYYIMRHGSIVNGTDVKTQGGSFVITYREILSNLTSNYEKNQLVFYVEGFCNRYMLYRPYYPEFDMLMKKFLKSAWDYGCWTVIMKLCFTYLIEKIPFGLRLLRLLRNSRALILSKKKK